LRRPSEAPLDQGEINRLRWQCRRGMLELDLLLEGFLDNAYPASDEEERARFVHLLAMVDPVLYDWLMGYTEVPDPALKELVRKIRDCQESRASTEP
jgi:antitoxin CptB